MFVTTIGVRELRQNASAYLARVRAGETIEVTDRGVPVALLVPVSADPYAHLVATGAVVPAGSPDGWRERVPVVPARDGEPSPSELLARMREDEER